MKNLSKLILLNILIGCGSSGGESSSFRIKPPVILGKNIYFVEENKREAFQIEATDNSSLKYYLSGKDSNLLYVDLLSGKVFFKEPTDFESKNTYNFTITIEDSVGNRTSKEITIKIKDDPNKNIIVSTEHNNSLPQSNEYFITTWQTNQPGVSANNQITIPTLGDGYNYNVDWGDGTSSKNLTLDTTHTYSHMGIYKVKIIGDFPRIVFHKDNTDNQKILSVDQWGNNIWTSMGGAFATCKNLEIYSQDRPDLSHVTSMHSMFAHTLKFNQDISSWDISHVTNIRWMFNGASAFNQNISSWDTSNVTTMDGIFNHAYKFNQDISSWNTSLVKNMDYMFAYAEAFEQDLSLWQVDNVQSHKAFAYATADGVIEPNWERKSNIINAIQKTWLNEKGISLTLTQNDILFVNDTTRLVKVSDVSIGQYTHYGSLDFIEYAIFDISTINNPRLRKIIRFEEQGNSYNNIETPTIKLIKNGIARFNTNHNIYLYDLNTNTILLDFLEVGLPIIYSFLENKDNKKIYFVRYESMEAPRLYLFNLDTLQLKASKDIGYYVPQNPKLSDDETKLIVENIIDEKIELNLNELLTEDTPARYYFPK